MTDRPSYPGMPRWVKVSGIVTLVLAVLVVIVMLAAGGSHGPSRHLPSGDAGNLTSPVVQGVWRPRP